MKRMTGMLAICALALAALGACSDQNRLEVLTGPVALSDPGTSGNTGTDTCKTATPDSQIPLPIAPPNQRVDLAIPSFSNPTTVTNPLFPISELAQVILLGSVEGEPLRVETTLLPETKTIDMDGQQVEVLVSQYVAYLDRRIYEVALDFYAQADDGAVWYFGEDVFNYEGGVIVDTEGTWLACRDGPAAMIMPAQPQVGNVYRPENIFGLVFEEVTVKSIGVTVDGPTGPVQGAIIVEELHQDSTLEDKTFAPGYGEFFTGSGSDVEAVALAVPTDALPGPLPGELETLSAGATEVFDAAQSGKWTAAEATLEKMETAWQTYRKGGAPPRLETQMDHALEALDEAVDARHRAEARQAAIDVALASLDFQLRHRPVTEIDFARLDIWARQLLVDAAANDREGVASDVAILEQIWDRVAHALDGSAAGRIQAHLTELRAGAERANFAVVLDAAGGLRLRLREGASHL